MELQGGNELRLRNPDERKDAAERMSNRHRLESATERGYEAREIPSAYVCESIESSSLYRLREVIRALTK